MFCDIIFVKVEIKMDELTNIEKKALLSAAIKIRSYKLMQAKGYERLAKKARDERTKRLLVEISTDEFKDSEYWLEKIKELNGYFREME
jgi:hypothetical protein